MQPTNLIDGFRVAAHAQASATEQEPELAANDAAGGAGLLFGLQYPSASGPRGLSLDELSTLAVIVAKRLLAGARGT